MFRSSSLFLSKKSHPSLWRTTAAAARQQPSPAVGTVRHLNVHEYISMEIMKSHGIATPECYVASTADEAEHIFTKSFHCK